MTIIRTAMATKAKRKYSVVGCGYAVAIAFFVLCFQCLGEDVPSVSAQQQNPTVTAEPSGLTTFEFSSGWASFLLVHPFKALEGRTTEISGDLHIDETRPNDSAKLSLSIIADSFRTPFYRANHRLAETLRSSKFPFIQFEGAATNPTQVDSPAPKSASYPMDGKLTIGGITKAVNFTLQCDFNFPAVNCTVTYPLSLDAFALSVPQLLRVSARSTVQCKGEMTFLKKG